VKGAGYEYAFMKATQGTWFIDKTFDTFRQGAKDAGLKVGYYHYFEPGEDADAQAKYFCDKIGKAEPDALRLVIDAEGDGWTKYSADQRVQMVDDFLKGVQKRIGAKPEVCIYCSPNFADEVLVNSPKLKDYSLWIANYNVNEPRLPGPWNKWDFWQYTSKGKVPGIKGNVDLDVFNGTDINQALKYNTKA
jgi:lysozyme